MANYNAQRPDAKALSNLLSAKPLQRLIKGSKDQQLLQQLIADVLPQNMLDNVTFCDIEQQQITLGVTNAAWATRLRAHRNDLLYGSERYRSLGRLIEVKIIIRPPVKERPAAKKKQHKPAKTPTESTVEMIQDTAQSCKNDDLKAALSRLAANMQVYSDEK